MGIALQRGHVEEVVQSDKNGAANCRVSEQKIRMSSTLAGIVAEGDNVLVAGEIKKNVLQAYAVNNLGKGKTARIDSTSFILLMGVGGYLGIMFGVISLMTATGGLIGSLQDVLSIAGFILAGVALRRVVLINRASNLISYRADHSTL